MGYGNQNRRLGFLGAGNMASAILGGLIKNGSHTLCAYDINPERLSALSGTPVRPVRDVGVLINESDIVFICVKPQNFPKLASQITRTGADLSGKLFVSIMAGVPALRIRDAIGADGVIQAMPNTPLMLGKGATALCRTPGVSDEQYGFVRDIFSALGTVADIEPHQMNAVISVNGSSPAYIYLLIKAVMDGAEKQGIEKETAKALICQTLVGAAEMALKSGKTPQELIDMVSSPGGTTLAALEALYKRGFAESVIEAMEACTRRAQELSG